MLVTFADDGGNHEIATSAATEAVVAAPNIPATGKPVIVGDPIIPPHHSTEALTVDLSGISDQNGMSGAEFRYTWHCVAEDWDDRCPIGNPWEPTYQLYFSLRGDTIKVYVSFMDDGGNVETLVSEPVGPVAYPNSPAQGAPLLAGIPRVGGELWVHPHGIYDSNGIAENSIFGYRYQWIADGTNIEGATSWSYVVKSTDVGKRIKFILYFTDDDGWPEKLESSPTSLVVAADSDNSPATGAPQINAHYPEVGDTLTTVTTTGYSGTNITDADGLTNAVFTYQWMRGDGTTYSDIPNATGMSYTLGDADEGKRLKVKVTFTDDAGNQESMFSAPSSPVDPGPTPSNNNPANNPAEGNAVISGAAKVGETLTVDVSGITDADGMEDALFGFTWTDGTYWIGMGFIDTWEVLPSYVGKQLTVRWLFYDDLGNRESGTVTTAAVEATVPSEPRAVAVEPGGTGELDVSWVEPDSDGGSEITSYTVQWKKATGIWDTDEDVSEATATSITHTITGLELDVEYAVRIIATNSIGDGAASDEVTATTVAAKPNSPATGTPTISGTAQVGETLTADTTGIDDSDGLADVSYNYQWLADDTEIASPTGNAYVLTSAELGKAVKLRVSFTDDAGNEESLTSAATDAVAAAPPPPPDNVRAVTQESGAVELTWEAPQDATVTGYRIERRRADENRGGQQRSDGQPRDNHTLAEDTGSAETGYTDESAEKGVEYEYRVSARNGSGPGEGSDWVRAGPASASNALATGRPTLRGTTQVGETLTADITGIADADGLSGETFAYQWVSSDGTTDTDMENATGSTYKLVAADQGKSVKVRVTFTDDGGNEETLTSAATGPVLGDGLPGAPRNLNATAGNKEITLSWDPPADNGNAPATRYRIEWRIDGKDYDQNHWGTARSTTYTTNDQANLANGVKYVFRVKAGNGSGNSYGPYGPASGEVSTTPTSGSAVDLGTPVLSDTETLHHGMVRLDWQDIEDAGWYVVQYYHLEGGEWLDLPAEGVEITFHGSSAVVSNLHGLSWLRVGAASCDGVSEWSQIEQWFGTKEFDWEDVPVPEVAEGDEIEPCPVVLGTPVLSEPEYLHHGMVQLDWQDIGDAGWYVVQYYHLEDGEWLDLPAEGVDIAFHGSSAVVSNLHGLSWLRVGAASCDGASEWSQIEELYGTNASDWKGVPVPEVAEGDEIEPCSEDADTPDNSPATGAPTIGGTAQVGETLTANTSGVIDADGLSNVQYEYQWLADDSDISGATNATYTLVAGDEGKAIKVEVSFTDDEGNDESLTSEPTAVVAAAPPPPPDNLRAVTQKSGAVELTWDAPQDATVTGYRIERRPTGGSPSDQQRSAGSPRDHHTLVEDTGSTDTGYTDNTAQKGVGYEYRVSARNEAGAGEESDWVDAEEATAPNSPATGAPTISGTAQVGETLTANTSGIADEDGLSGATFSYQWVANDGNSDTDITGATDYTYTLAAADEGKAIKVQVGFTDDADNEETLTSAATGAVVARPNSPATGAPTISGTAQVGEVLTVETSGVADVDGLGNVQYEYQWLADDADMAGATSLTYTLIDVDEGKAIKVRVSFTDDADNAETLTSAATAAVTAAPPSIAPGEPQNLELTPVAVGTNGVGIKVFWDAPSATGGSDISGYRIQWKGGSQDYPDDQETRQAFVENAPYTIDTTSPTPIEGDELTVRIAAVNGAGAGVWTEKIGWLPSHTDLELWLLMKEYADEKQTTFPWVLETWNYLDRYEVPVEVGPTPGFGSVILLPPCVSPYTDGDDGLKECHVEKIKILQIEDPKPHIIIHEMAHAFTLANRVTDAPGPLAIGHLYFDSLNLQGGLRGCEPRELYADVLTMLTLDIDKSSYWKTCNQWNAQREAQALDVLRSAVDGEMPQWFADTYTDAEDEPDLERLWTDVQDLPRIERNVAVYQLRDAFGGYCNNRLTWMSMQYSEDKLTQPWMDGGCPPPEPSSLEVTPGDGELTLAWDAPASDGDSDVEGYIVQWKSVYKSYDDWATRRQRAVLDSPTSLTYTISGLVNGVEYDVRVRAYNLIGPGQPLDVESVPLGEPVTPNTPATGVPTISGTAQVGETLTVDTSGIADEDGMENGIFTFFWQVYDATGWNVVPTDYEGTYTIEPRDVGMTIYVLVFFVDDAGNGEALTSAATDAVAAAPAANSPATGAPTITGTVQVGETLTADTSGIADADGLGNVQYEYQWLAEDTDIGGASGLTYTLTDSEESKAITVQVSFTDDAGNEETLTSAATDAVAAAPTTNTPATGAPTISGTVQVGETLTANTSGIADADGLSNVQYDYQWLADDTDIAGATGLTYTLTDSEESKAITVQVSFTDDAGNGETLTSEATDAAATAEPSEPPDKPKGLEATSTHDSVTLTWDDPQDESITGYVILRRVRVNDQGGDFSVLVANTGSAATTYTDNEVAASTTYTYRIKAINEHGVSERSRWVHIDTPAPPVPDKPTGLEATASNGQVVLTWDDPQDDSITGYVILRRVRVNDQGGDFSELVADTGTAATTYTDDTVAAETSYTYRIKAINEYGVSERSRWFHIDTPAAPDPAGSS